MKPIVTKMIKNGDRLEPYNIYRCECCDKKVEEAWPKVITEDGVYCGDCAFKLGIIDESEYLSHYCTFRLDGMRAAVHDGEIYLQDHNRKFPWEKTKKQQRNSQEYIDWRSAVFERDGYRCQICGQIGGTLNAHHIKSFSKHESLRFDLNNGVTLCESCHKRVHKEKNKKWIK